VIGNHDANNGVTYTYYNTYFPYSRYSSESWYGGAYGNNNANSFQLFSNGDDDYLILHIEYDANSSVLAWASTVLANYPDRRVILATHDYMTGSGGARSSYGTTMWNNFISPHADQIFLVLCGHATREDSRTDIVNGHTVYQLLADYQSDSSGGNGWLRILTFRPAEDEIYVQTYSPWLDQYETDGNSQFTLAYDMTGEAAEPPVLIGTALNVPSGGTASVQWAGLDPLTEYYWYAVASDADGGIAQSETWSFTTGTGTVKFDFGPASSPVEPGYYQVTPATLYDSIVGYGWTSTTGCDCRDRGTPDSLRRDFVFGSVEKTFKVDLANGDYLVTMTIGDQNFMHDMIDVYAEGILKVDGLTTTAGSFREVSFRVSVVDGQLTLRIVDNGGIDSNWVLDGLTIEVASPLPSENWFDFGTNGSPVQAGYTQVTSSSLYSAAAGYGWASTVGLDSRDRSAPNDLRRDFVFSSAEKTFCVDVANGYYLVTVTIGDQGFMHDFIDIYAEGALMVNGLSAAAGSFQEVSFKVTVADGQLNLSFLDDGGLDGNWVLNTLAVVVAPPLPTEAAFDFGTAASPTETGYVQVTSSSVYSAAAGYGWASTVGLDSRDRSAPNDLRRDFVFSSAEKTFCVDVANGYYLVTVTIGDQGFMHDLIDVYAEDVLVVNDLSAAAGQFQQVPFVAHVTDGQLNLRFLDDGGTDTNWVLNSLTIQSL
jgi:fibronectin type 3 domain-containing protein